MATYDLVVFGWLHKDSPFKDKNMEQYEKTIKENDYKNNPSLFEHYEDLSQDYYGSFDFKQAQIRCFEKMGFTNITHDDFSLYADTPLGQREFSIFQLHLYYQPFYGQKLEESLIGLQVSSRYHPTFLDWRDKLGGLFNFQIYPPTQEMEIVAKEIPLINPEFKTAKFFVHLVCD